MKIFHLILILLLLFSITLNINAQNIPEYIMQDTLVTDCEGILLDSGGYDAPYSNDETFTFTICPDQPHTCLRLFVDSASIENNFDFISFYDGPEVLARDFLGSFSGELSPIIDAFSGCLTIQFISDNSTPEKGWTFHWECSTGACPSTPLSPQDCVGAIPICQDQYFEANAYQGTGFLPEEINNNQSCLTTGEKNDVWYVFTVQESGQLHFTITPNDLLDDYDWAVFNLTEQECAAIFDLPELEVACNFSSTPGLTGPNGLEGIQNEAEISVLKGETYVINVSQFSTSLNGYAIDFSASSAVIFDNVPPELQEVLITPNCGENNVRIRFSENVLCSSVSGTDFQLVGPEGQFYTLTNQTQICQSDAAAYENRYQFQTDQPLTELGTYSLQLVGDISDICGNTTSTSATVLPFTITPPAFLGNINDVVVCEKEAAIIQGDTNTVYQFYTAEGISPHHLLDSGTQLIVTDLVSVDEPTTFFLTQFINGCESEAVSVTVTRLPNDIAAFTLPNIVCLTPDTPNPIPQLAPDAHGNGFFSINNNGVIDSLSGTIDLTQTPAGNYLITYTTISDCSNSSTQTIALIPDFTIDIDTSTVMCLPNSHQFEIILTIQSDAVESSYQVTTNNLEQTILANTPTPLLFIGDGQDDEITVVDTATSCTKSTIISSPICTNQVVCPTDAGTIDPIINHPVCFGTSIQVTAMNPIVPEDHILTYVLHDGDAENLGNILAFDETGTFNAAIQPTAIDFYTPYFISSLVGLATNNNGLPDLNDSCTVHSLGTAITFLAPITTEVTQICNRTTENYDFYVSITGGLPEFQPTTNYQITGATTGQLPFGEILLFSIPFTEEGSNYQLDIMDNATCTHIFSDVLLSCTTLPIQLHSFFGTAISIGNQLEWATSSEYNNAYFQLLHATDGRNFLPITTVNSSGNSSIAQQYSFLHPTTQAGLHYYQLRQTDEDGQATTVATISVERSAPPIELHVFPQPATNVVYFNWANLETTGTQFKLYDISGRLITTQQLAQNLHTTTQQIDLTAYTTGIYFVELSTTTGQVIRKKLIKQ